MLHRQAEALYRAHSNNNEFGIDNEKWDLEIRQDTLRLRNRSDEAFLRTLEQNQEWADLELLLRELNELGARPLLLSMPIHGGWYEHCGITYSARRAYYEKLRGISARYHIPVVDFADHDSDQTFCHDTMGHLAPNGLVYYNQVYDGFFHDGIPSQSALPAAYARGEQRDRSQCLAPAGARVVAALGRFPRPILDGESTQGGQDEARLSPPEEKIKSHEFWRSA